MKITSSATFVAWSPIRSRCREMWIKSRAGSMVEGIPEHVGQQLAQKDPGLQRVERVVLIEDGARQSRVTPDVGVERIAQHTGAQWSAIRGISMSSLTAGC